MNKTKAFVQISFYNLKSEIRIPQSAIPTDFSLFLFQSTIRNLQSALYSVSLSIRNPQSPIRNGHSPINRAMIIFMTSVVPAAMDPMRMSRASREIWYSSM